MGFLEFCGNISFWDEDLLLNNSWPQFTPCFQQTALVWGPCGFLWIASLAYLPYLRHVTAKVPGRIAWLSSAKIFLSLLLCLMSVVSAVKNVQSHNATSVYLADGLQAATFLYSSGLTILERKRGLVTSGVQFLFWLFVVICDVIPFYSYIIKQVYDDDVFTFSLFCLHYTAALVLFVLQFFSDDQSRDGYRNFEEENASPETRASFPSRLAFCWAQRLMSTGFKKSLESCDLFSMGADNQSRHIVPSFNKAWAHEIRRVDDMNVKRQEKRRNETIKASNQHFNEKTLLLSQRAHHETNGNGVTFHKKENGEAPFGATVPKQGNVGAGAPTQKENNETKKKPSLLRVLVSCHWAPFSLAQALMLVYTLLQFVNPLVLSALLDYVSARDERPEWQGYVIACSFLVASSLSTFIYHQTMHSVMPIGMRMKSAIISAVYAKALTMSNESRCQSTVGEIVNLMSIDCQRVQDVTTYLYMIWSLPLTIVIAMYQLWGILGPACLAGLGVMLLVVPVNAVVVSRQRKIQISTMKIKDARLKLMAEVLNGMKVLKLYGWEPAFQEKVAYHRNMELGNLHKIAYLNAFSMFVWTLIPYLVTLASFTAYILTSEFGYLDASKAFVSLSLFELLRQPVNLIPAIIPAVIQAGVSMKRINKFLNWGDLNPDNVVKDPKAENVIKIDNGTFTWDKELPKPTLQNIQLKIAPGKLMAVVGPVGCGKSSLLAAILGEMEKVRGTVTTKTSIAYVPQEAWIQNATVRDNIVFGSKWSQRRYDQVVEACALQADFRILMGGDMTEIGEKGINLSGGQKQRVSLARAVYSDADTYLFDDPLSAVDSHVGKHIFSKVIGPQGLLAHKTRVLVTHGIHWLPMVDEIVVLNDGRVSETGSYEELLSQDGAFAAFLKLYLHTEEEDEEGEEDPEIQRIKQGIFQRLESITSDPCTSGDEIKDGLSSVRKRRFRREISHEPHKTAAKPDQKAGDLSKLVEEEQSMQGSVKMSVYMNYLRALGSRAGAVVVLLYALFTASSLTSSIWLSAWTDDATLANTSLAGTAQYNDLNALYLGIYGGLGILQAIFILCYSILYNTRMVRATGNMHAAMLTNIMRSPMSFFDTTPIGRIINRFSRDVDVMDVNLPQSVRMTLQAVGRMLSTLILISYSSPVFLSVVIPLGGLYKLVQMFYIKTSRQLKRLESTTRSPVYTHFTETLQGAASIRAYGAGPRFLHESQKRVDTNLVSYYAYLVSQRWLGVRLELLGTLITLSAALFAILNTGLSSGLVGLSVTYALNITNILNMIVRVSSELESNIVSTERIQEYTETETEAPWVKPGQHVDDDWPAEGKVEFKDFQMRYRPGLDLVLRGISLAVRGGEKIGIVGRTGAGKSSLTVALFRLAEAAGGSVVVDGHDVGNLGLHSLRGRLTILPQDPVIFSGTLRMNLDPTGRHSEDELWNAIQHAHLHAFVSNLPAKLDYECGEGGQNLSMGQRQLMCLARSLLRKSKILVLDEATAAVDMETDEVIQQTIRSEFKDSTVLTIAHRLNTIMDYDRILVMDEGKVKEFESPATLLANPGSDFYSMAKAAGLV